MEKVQWRIYYDDYSTFDSSQGEPEDAPPLGVIAIVQYRKDGLRFVVQSFDWYLYHLRDENWWGIDREGVFDQFCHFPRDVIALKAGRNVSDEVYAEILKNAVEDKDFLNE